MTRHYDEQTGHNGNPGGSKSYWRNDRKTPIKRDMQMVEADEAGGVAGAMRRKTTCVSFMAASTRLA